MPVVSVTLKSLVSPSYFCHVQRQRIERRVPRNRITLSATWYSRLTMSCAGKSQPTRLPVEQQRMTFPYRSPTSVSVTPTRIFQVSFYSDSGDPGPLGQVRRLDREDYVLDYLDSQAKLRVSIQLMLACKPSAKTTITFPAQLRCITALTRGVPSDAAPKDRI